MPKAKIKKLNKDIIKQLEDLGIDLMQGPEVAGYCLYCKVGETYPRPEAMWWMHCVECDWDFPVQ